MSGIYERLLEFNRPVFYEILEMQERLKDTHSMETNKILLFETIRRSIYEILDAIDKKYGFSTGMVDYLIANYRHPEVEKLYEKGIEFKLRFRLYKDTYPAETVSVGNKGDKMDLPEMRTKLLRIDMEPIIND